MLPSKEWPVQKVDELVEQEQLLHEDTIALLPITTQSYVHTPIKLVRWWGKRKQGHDYLVCTPEVLTLWNTMRKPFSLWMDTRGFLIALNTF